MDPDVIRTVDAAPKARVAADHECFVRSAACTTITEMVEAVMRGEPHLALTGLAGCGKTTAAGVFRDELTGRSVRVLSVSSGRNGRLGLQDIASQLLGKSQGAGHEDHVEALFDIMTAHEASPSRFVLILDDAHALQTTAIEYLRLLSSITTVAAPQLVFVGRPEFWDVADRAAISQFKERITARWEIGPLHADEMHLFVDRLLEFRKPSDRPVFDARALDALIERSEGLYGRVISLLAAAEIVQQERHEPWLTPGAIEAAAVRLDTRKTPSPGQDARLSSATWNAIPRDPSPVRFAVALDTDTSPGPDGEALPLPEGALASDHAQPSEPVLPPPTDALALRESYRAAIESRDVAKRTGWRRPYAYAAGAVLVLCTAATVIQATVMHWQGSTAQMTVLPHDIVVATNLSAPAGSAATDAGAGAGGQDRTAEAPTPKVALQTGFAGAAPAAEKPPDGAGAVAVQTGIAISNGAQSSAAPSDAIVPDQAPATSVAHDPTPPSAAPPATPTGPGSSAVVIASVTSPPAVRPGPQDSEVRANLAAPAQASSAAPPSSGAINGGGREPVPVAPPEREAPQPQAGAVAADLRGGMTAPAPSTGFGAPDGSAAVEYAARPTPQTGGMPQPAVPAAHPTTDISTALQQLAAAYVARGDAMVAIKDISAARKFYEMAADAGSAQAAMAMARTYDPAFLSQVQAFGLRADPTLAAAWYRRAAALGAADAPAELLALGGGAAR